MTRTSRPPAPPRVPPGRAGGARGTARDPRLLLALLLGGVVGTVLRALMVDAWAHGPTSWPWATFAANVAGALALGVVVAVLRTRPSASPYWRPLLGTGLCGGLTTFSTMQLELVRMGDEGAIGLAAAYLVASVVGGLAAVTLGLRLGSDARARHVFAVVTVDDGASVDDGRPRSAGGASDGCRSAPSDGPGRAAE